ncbi:DNA-directed RNA polymerase sigma-70 factor [Adhaeribacter aerolatus]|uniref:DNA-directed RNA polymerase sigma-70 factor n=1 Tax=Adhaeribacter aerolatus TaxID=670289 RepID=A0A512AZP8_9BACT|nr:sigma-70 family RNA polymerase sigma factor [Adhaeribacter aerolatus]GEO05193.1 DNA-directed RNA polymerase sigma-70 factor [Adhaeribacter aerolatus]
MEQLQQAHSESFIWEEFRNGSEAAYTTIYNRYAANLFNYGYKLAHDRDLTKDCIQEVFVNLWRSRENLSPTSSIKYYLFKALRHEIMRKLNPRNFTSDLPDNYHFEVVLSAEQLLILDQTTAVKHERLLQELEKLPARQKEAIFLRFYDNLSFEEIAAIMQIEQRSVYKMIYKAIENLQNNLVNIKVLLVLLFISEARSA